MSIFRAYSTLQERHISSSNSRVNTVPVDLTVTLLRCENHSRWNTKVQQEKESQLAWIMQYSSRLSRILLYSLITQRNFNVGPFCCYTVSVDAFCKLWLYSTLKDVGRILTKLPNRTMSNDIRAVLRGSWYTKTSNHLNF